jgi:mono/diheme cytochrome c family protein
MEVIESWRFSTELLLGGAVLKRCATMLLVLFASGWTLKADQPQTPPKDAPPAEFKIPPDAAKEANPVKMSPESLAKGKKFYHMDCAMCHGDKGDGKGDLASDMKGVTDFTNPDSLKARTDGDLFYITRQGKGEMPPEGDRAKKDDVWNMVNYIRSLAKRKE